MAEIDLVCPWVDGNDPAWQQEWQHYASPEQQSSAILFRDWDLMRYWFRGVEKALPWIRTVHFVTWGHLPLWLNTAHPKLHIVRHDAFLPKAYRPTFNSGAIMLNIHRIPGLAEQFILSNDDCFFLDSVAPEEYFQSSLPCDCLHILPITEVCTDHFGHTLWNNISCLNEHFDLQACMAAHREKWFADCYSAQVKADNQLAASLRHFPGFDCPHLPQPYLKSTFAAAWGKAYTRLHYASKQKFRTWSDHTEWLMRYWQLASGQFVPYVRRGGRAIALDRPKADLRDTVLSTQNRVICLNEGAQAVDFISRRDYLKRLFERALPQRSAFEKD